MAVFREYILGGILRTLAVFYVFNTLDTQYWKYIGCLYYRYILLEQGVRSYCSYSHYGPSALLILILPALAEYNPPVSYQVLLRCRYSLPEYGIYSILRVSTTVRTHQTWYKYSFPKVMYARNDVRTAAVVLL